MFAKNQILAAVAVFSLTVPQAVCAQTPAPSPSPAPQAALPAAGMPPPPSVRPLLRDSLLAAVPTTFTFSNGRILQFGGFVYARYDDARSNRRTGNPAFPEGSGTPNGYNGNGDNGFNNSTFKIRESRIFALATLSPNVKAIVEIAPSGQFNTTAAGSTAINTRRLYGQYTFGDGKADKLTITAGQFWNPFGFAISNPLPFWYTPERPLLAKESARGLWDGQEFDRGVQLSLAPKDAFLSLSVINGTGLTSNDTNRARDIVFRARKFFPKSGIALGGSYYTGTFAASIASGTAPNVVTTITGNADRKLYGFDAQYTSPSPNSGPYLQAEYVGGTLEAITPITLGDPKAATPTYPSAFVSGNKIEGYSLIGGWTFNKSSAHPWSLIGMYDSLDRNTKVGSLTDTNYGFGASYNLAPGVKARAFYTKPAKVAYTGATAPDKIVLITADLIFVL